MQLVIEINDEIYKEILNEKESGWYSYIWGLVRTGTPLPKGHGDLIDRKELLKQPMDKANYPSNYVKIAPTIIEADKESEGK